MQIRVPYHSTSSGPEATGKRRFRINCLARGVSSIEAHVYKATNQWLKTGGPWECDDHEGEIRDVPAGGNGMVMIHGLDSNGDTIYRGESETIALTPGEVFAGTIEAHMFIPELEAPDKASTIKSQDCHFKWSVVTGASQYRIQVSDEDGFTNPLLDVIVATAMFSPSENLTTGLCYWRVQSLDIYGEESKWSDVWDVTIFDETKSPTVNITSPVTDPYYTSTSPVTISGTASVDGGITLVTWSNDKGGSGNASGTTSWSASIPLQSGDNVITITAHDAAGNTGTDTITINYDTTSPPPPNDIIADPNRWTNHNSFVINWTNPVDQSGIAGTYYKLGSAPASQADGNYVTYKPFTVSVTAEGGQDIYVWLKDGAGNADPNHYSHTTLFYDATPPMDGNISVAERDGQIALSWSGFSDAASGINTYILACSTSGYPSSYMDANTFIYFNTNTKYVHTNLENNTTYYYRLWAVDNAYNDSNSLTAIGTPQSTHSTDTTSPDPPINLTVDPNNWSKSNAFDIDWINPNDPSGIEGAYYKLGSAPVSQADGNYITDKPFMVAATVEGGQDIYVWLKDGAGNADPNHNSPAKLRYDATPPIDGNISLAEGDEQITLTWSGFSDAASGIKQYILACSTNGYPSCIDPNTIIYSGTDTHYVHLNLKNGTTYYYQICAIDNAYNDSNGITASGNPLSIIYVDIDAQGINDGTSWENAFNNLQDAIGESNPGAEIWVASGIYKPDEGNIGDRNATFQLKNDVKIYGGFAGGETTLDERNWEENQTILSGDLENDDNDPNSVNSDDNSYHVVTGSGTDETALLDGFIITAGNANGTAQAKSGGGIYNHTGSPTIKNCTFMKNTASYGGGMYNYQSNPILTRCTFSNNASDLCGGGINNDKSSPIINNCTFHFNSAIEDGGGIYSNNESKPTVKNCIFHKNVSKDGGGMFNYSTEPKLINCMFTDNLTSNTGGGLTNISCSSHIVNCTFSGNKANTGGGINDEDGKLWVINCILWGNSNSQINTKYEDLFLEVPPPKEIYIDYCNIQGGRDGIHLNNYVLWEDTIIPDDPQFGAEYHIQGHSPCRNAANPNSMPPEFPTNDIDEEDRPHEGYYDIGADEFYDSDGDWVPDFWETKYHLNQSDPNNADDDPDTDNLTNLEEYQNGTDPTKTDTDGDGNDDGLEINTGSDPLDPNSLIKIYFVNRNISGGKGDGTSWSNAFQYLQYALDLAKSGDEIWVATGTYSPDEGKLPGDRNVAFELKNGISLYGGFAGYEKSIVKREGGQTTLTGDLNRDDSNFYYYPCDAPSENFYSSRDDNSYHVVTCTNIDANSILDSFIIEAGNARDGSQNGAGMYNVSSSPKVINCIFRYNLSYLGGGIYNNASNPTFLNCKFDDNVSDAGGGMYNNNSNPTIIDCEFGWNTAAFDGGAGIYNSGSNLIVINCIFEGNNLSTSQCGGFTGGGYNADGGGIYNAGSSTEIRDCTFELNYANGAGGGIYNVGNNTILENCIFIRNTTDTAGGGLANFGQNLKVINCIFKENKAWYFGGGTCNCGSSIMTNCTFSENEGSDQSGGIFIDGGSPTIINCILWNNTAPNGSQIGFGFSGGSLSINYSDVQGGEAEIYNQGTGNIDWGSENIGLDPLLMNDYHLQSESPCIDAGTNEDAPSKDMDHVTRPQDGDGDGEAICDMGAYEYSGPTPPQNLHLVSTDNNNILIAWDTSIDLNIAGYRVFCKEETQNYNYDAPIWEGTETSCLISSLNANTNYYFVVRTFDLSGFESSNSNELYVGLLTPENTFTVYEDAEDGKTDGWIIVDQDPNGGIINNVFDTGRQSRVIELTNISRDSLYLLGNPDGSKWHNSTQFIAKWSLCYSNSFIVFFDVETTAGHRYLYYTPDDYSTLGSGIYVHHGLGSEVTDGQWHTFERDLQADIEEGLPGVNILEVNNIKIYGSGRVDDIILRQTLSP